MELPLFHFWLMLLFDWNNILAVFYMGDFYALIGIVL